MMRSLNGWRGLALWALAAAGVGLCLTIPGIAAQTDAPEAKPERFSAIAVNMGSAGPTGPGVVQIVIDRWSTPEERQVLIQAFREKGDQGLLDALQKSERLGTIRTPNRLGWDLHYAAQVPLDNGGRRILLATDRVIGFWEASRGTRTMDYPFTLIELHLDKENLKGEGRISLATKIAPSKDGKHIELENYSSEPVRLQNVRKLK